MTNFTAIFYDNFYDKFGAFCGNHAAMIAHASYEALSVSGAG